MPIGLWIFLFGLLVFGLIVVATFLLYVEAFEEEAEYEGYRMPPWVQKVFTLLGAPPSKSPSKPPPRAEEPSGDTHR